VNWLLNHYVWVIGLVVLLIIAIFIQRWIKSSHKTAGDTLTQSSVITVPPAVDLPQMTIAPETKEIARYVYFDTDVFHHMGRAFSHQGLSIELRERILLSPITILEALSHLTLKNNAEILSDIHAIHNWMNPNHAGLLPWSGAAIARIAFHQEPQKDEFAQWAKHTIDLCLNTDSPEEIRASASELKDRLDAAKDSTTQEFVRLVEDCRKDPSLQKNFSEMWRDGTARRAEVDPQSRSLEDVVAALSAYHEFEEVRLRVAVSDLKYKPKRNDTLDAEQLLYLGDFKLHFLTNDGGYLNRIKKSPQAARIHRAALAELSDATNAEAVLRKIIA
jgi:hypothetical protein